MVHTASKTAENGPKNDRTSGFTLPVITAKLLFTVNIFERMNDALLQRPEVLANFVD